ncbi:hypothetical protein [Vibrio fluvialis]|uniref:hypothetical protein n=1 Tax=Vibrio fluvialis TaxID=676 RepID=UPI003D0EE82F
MKEKLTFHNVLVTVLSVMVCSIAGWGLTMNTDMALLKQRVKTEEDTRAKEDRSIVLAMQESRQNFDKMNDTMIKLDKTLSILADRLDRADISIGDGSSPRRK